MLFTTDDLNRLAAAIQTCVTPLAFPTREAWRRSLVDAVVRLTHAEAGHCSLRGFDGVPTAVAQGYDQSIFDGYDQHWVHEDPGYELTKRVDMRAYTRRYMLAAAGPLWAARYKRSAVWNEFYSANGLVEGAGMLFVERGTIAHLHADTFSTAGEHMDERGLALLRVLSPAFRAGTSLVLGLHASEWKLESLLQAVPQPLALYDSACRCVHMNDAYKELLRLEPALFRAETAARIERLIRAAIPVPRSKRGLVDEVLRAPRAEQIGDFRLSVSLVNHEGVGATYVLLSVTRTVESKPSMVQARLAGLSKREAQVATLIVDGRTNREIAGALGIAVHTARRHSERILKKLGVTSRRLVRNRLLEEPLGR